jgi:ATP-dependent Lhr-like helicase
MADAAALSTDILPERFNTWFESRGWCPRAHQLEMVAKARAGRDALLIAPTGGGKTLAGFLPSLIELSERPPPNTPRGIHTLYISPLKALAVDVERNLMAPILQMGLPIVAESRTGDTGQARRQRQRVKPPDILLTTPEQLALFCAWEGARLYFEDLACVIVDEIHAIHASKRGDLLALDLARLQQFAPNLRRVGLSATVDDPDVIRRWLGYAPPDPLPLGDGAAVAQASKSPSVSLAEQTIDLVRGPAGAAPIVDMLLSEGRVPWAGHTAKHAMEEVYETIKGARTALVFVNTRFQAEFAFQELWRLNDDNLPIALHHGSLAAEQRRKVEAAMARGELRAVVCTSTLDLGIDWGDVDLVIQLASPKGASRMVQRIGRANHRLDEPSRALFVPANRFEMLECQAAREAIAENRFDGDPPRIGALDVLAQHVMGCACSEPFDLLKLYDEVCCAGPYRNLQWEDFEQVVDFVSTGGYALKTYDRFRRIVKGLDGLWRVRNAQTAQRHRLNVGAILSPAMLSVRIAMGKSLRGGRKVGEVEEGMLEMLDPGDTFVFAGQVWRLVAVTGLDVLVSPAADKDPKMPSWGGSKFALSTFLAKRVRELMYDQEHWKVLPNDVREWLEIQRDRSIIPKEGEMLLETFARGKRHFMVVYPFEGRLAHTTLAMLLTRRLERLGAAPLGFVCNDYAMAIWALRPMDGLDFDELFDQDMLGDDLESWLAESFMMKRAFKGCAIISGLIERRFPGEEKSGRQVTFSTDLIYDVLRRHQPDHLLLRCARDDAATGLIDVARLGQMLERIKGRIRHAALDHLSPFSVPILLEIGKERSPGQAGEMILAEAEEDLIAEAIA